MRFSRIFGHDRGTVINVDPATLASFVDRQSREFGAQMEIETGVWALFAVAAANAEENALAQALLSEAKFAHNSGSSEDDQWNLYYVDAAHRAAAMHWLDDLQRRLAGQIRLPSPFQRQVIEELAGSEMPHRLAQKLVEQHTQGELGAGSVRDPKRVRALLDRLHMHEPLFFSAFQQLLANHLLDLVVVLQQLIPEDIDLANLAIKGSVSRDPFLASRQAAAAEIRNLFVRFFLINSLDQQKNTAIRNPYAAYLEIVTQGENVTLALDGTNVTVSRAQFIDAIHSIRRNLYRGAEFESLDTQAPWMRGDIAHAFRFIKQRLEIRKELTRMDGLYMLERAVE